MSPNASLQTLPEANEIFVRLPSAAIRRLKEAGARFHPWPMPGDGADGRTVRLVTSFQTAPEEVDHFLGLLKS